MSEHAPAQVYNFDDREIKRAFMSHVGTLRGLWEIKLRERKRTRTLDQNGYYWVAICAPLAYWMSEQSGEPFTKDDAHEWLKSRFCPRREFVNRVTGEVEELRRSTSDLDTGEFSFYLDECTRWLGEFCGIEVIRREEFLEGAKRY